MTANVKFAKVRPDAKIPSKRDEDMGFDVYACFDEDFIFIHSRETKLIPTGIASSCDSEYGFVLKERGSTGSKGIALRMGVVDSGYRGEWMIGLTNHNRNSLCISKLSEDETRAKAIDCMMDLHKFANEFAEQTVREMYEKILEEFVYYPYSKAIAQALVIPVPKTEIKEISYEELQDIKSERGVGKLGSSGK